MLKEFLSKFMGMLFASRKASASGLYGQPTFAQVERLIAAAKGEEYVPPARPGLYSQPTFDQVERLIAAVGGTRSAIAGIPVGDYGNDPSVVAERLDAVLRAMKGVEGPDDRTLYFLALEDNSTVAMAAVGNDAPTVSLEYSLGDVGDWEEFTVGTTTVTLAKGQWVRIRATGDSVNTQLAKSDNDCNRFVLGGSIAVGGNSMSLFYNAYSSIAAQKSFPDATNEYTLAYLFRGASALKDASRLLLPAEKLVRRCYRGMFTNCTSLVQAPALPATTLAYSCYSYMFNNCASLMAAPALPATTLDDYCYLSMFYSCSSLCRVEADFGSFPYEQFAKDATKDWLSGVALEGEFHCKPGLEILASGASTVPERWTVVRDR